MAGTLPGLQSLEPINQLKLKPMPATNMTPEQALLYCEILQFGHATGSANRFECLLDYLKTHPDNQEAALIAASAFERGCGYCEEQAEHLSAMSERELLDAIVQSNQSLKQIRAAEQEYDPETCFTAAELRGLGVELSNDIPDAAWIPRLFVQMEDEGWQFDGDKLTLKQSVSFSAPFRHFQVEVIRDAGKVHP